MNLAELRRPFNAVFISRESRTGVSEGLNVLFADLVRSLVALEFPVHIFTTERHLSGLEAVLIANGVDPTSVLIKPVIKGSRVLNLGWSGLKRDKGGLLTLLRNKILGAFRVDRLAQQIAWLIDFSLLNFPFKLLLLIGLFVLGALIFFALIPLLFLFGLSFIAARFIKKLIAKSLKVGSMLISRGNDDGYSPVFSYRTLMLAVRKLAPTVFEELYRLESTKFARALKAQKQTETYFFCNSFEGYIVEALGQHKKKVVVFPDAVGAIFPTRYPSNWYGKNLLRSGVTCMMNADGIVCYSEYVRDHQLKRFLGSRIAQKRVAVIPQGFFIDKASSDTGTLEELNGFVRDIIGRTTSKTNVQFGSFEYVLYPTVDRPHKNTLTLLRAVETLIRKHQVNIKLITTSHSASEDLRNYIQEKHLEREILFMPSLPVDALNKLISGALAVVHPSLAEGGDIFNFSRAVSHGCPALLSDVVVSREMFERYGLDRKIFSNWLFNPFDQVALSQKIIDVKANRLEFITSQKAVLEILSSYKFENMASKYYDFVSSV